MKVKDIMTANARVCSPDTNLAVAAALMLDGDCGILPVVDSGRLIGVVTDRDMYIALATRNARASDVAVREVARSPVRTCEPDDEIHEALATMKQHRVRRLPVEGFGGTLAGVISIDDVLLAAGPRKVVSYSDVAEVFQTICAQHRPTPHVTAA